MGDRKHAVVTVMVSLWLGLCLLDQPPYHSPASAGFFFACDSDGCKNISRRFFQIYVASGNFFHYKHPMPQRHMSLHLGRYRDAP